MTDVARSVNFTSFTDQELYGIVYSAVANGLIGFLRAGAANLVELPLQGGASFAANPAFVMAIQALTGSTTQITVAGKGLLVILDSYQNVIDALRAGSPPGLESAWPEDQEESIREIAHRIANQAVSYRKSFGVG